MRTLTTTLLTASALFLGAMLTFAEDAPLTKKPSPEDSIQIQISNLNIQIGQLQGEKGQLQQNIGRLSEEIIRLTTCLKAGWNYDECGNWAPDGLSVMKVVPAPKAKEEPKKEAKK